MIDPKSFIEFFAKEYGVKFVDANTGRNALDIINESRKCKTCEHIIRGGGKVLHAEDMVCGNPQSNHLSDFRMNDDTCNLWEERKKEE